MIVCAHTYSDSEVVQRGDDDNDDDSALLPLNL